MRSVLLFAGGLVAGLGVGALVGSLPAVAALFGRNTAVLVAVNGALGFAAGLLIARRVAGRGVRVEPEGGLRPIPHGPAIVRVSLRRMRAVRGEAA